jgi:hypothetical protein
MSQMPRTPWRRMSSATLNASFTGVFLPTADSRRSLGMMISVSTLLRRLLMASSACSHHTNSLFSGVSLVGSLDFADDQRRLTANAAGGIHGSSNARVV